MKSCAWFHFETSEILAAKKVNAEQLRLAMEKGRKTQANICDLTLTNSWILFLFYNFTKTFFCIYGFIYNNLH